MNTGTATENNRKIKVVQFPAPVRRLLIPREHGSWGLWLLPLITGAVVGAAHVHRSSLWALLWLFIAAFSAFLAYQPLEALLGSSPYKVRSALEKKVVAGWVLLCSIGGVIGALALWMLGHGHVLWFGALGVACFGVRLLLSRARRFRVTRQILGALSLSSAAAAAYFVTTGTLDSKAILLWGANWLFAVGQIEYVQVRVRMAAVLSRPEKLRASLGISLYHVVLLYFASIGAAKHMVHPFFAIAFLPAVLRILVWAVRKPAKTNFHVLGFGELFQSVLFSGILLTAFLQP